MAAARDCANRGGVAHDRPETFDHANFLISALRDEYRQSTNRA
jgi:hypothetical protein